MMDLRPVDASLLTTFPLSVNDVILHVQLLDERHERFYHPRLRD